MMMVTNNRLTRMLLPLLAFGFFLRNVDAFSPRPSSVASPLKARSISRFGADQVEEKQLRRAHTGDGIVLRAATTTATSGDIPPHTIQILMSDTGGGHRASANALRDALDVLYPSQFAVDIVDIYTDYGPVPYNQYVPAYKIMAEYSFLWDWFYHFGATPLGLALNEFFLDLFCFQPFKDCMGRCTPLGSDVSAADAKSQSCKTTGRRADMVISVHPLCQDETLKILAYLDSDGKSKDGRERTKTPFVTVVTDLGGAHPTWFNPG